MPSTRYVASADLVAYALERGVSLTLSEASVLITRAQDYLDTTYMYAGEAISYSAAFPRKGLRLFSDDIVPEPITRATCIVAMLLESGTPLDAGGRAEPQVKREVIAASKIETEYATNYASEAVRQNTRVSAVTNLLAVAELLDEMSAVVNLRGVRM